MERAPIRLQDVPDAANLDEPAAQASQSANRDNSIECFNRQAARLDRQYHDAARTLNQYRRNKGATGRPEDAKDLFKWKIFSPNPGEASI